MKSSILTKLGIGFIALFAFLILAVAWLKVPAPTNKNTELISGQIEYIGSPCCKDIGIRLVGDSHFYYINRGTEQGLDADDLSYQLSGERITMRIIETRWSPLNPGNRTVPVAELSFNDEVIFSSMVN